MVRPRISDWYMIKALFFDIDGTIVPIGDHGIPADTRQALAEARERGVKLFISTGRHMDWINNLGDEIFDGYVTANGSLCMDSSKKKVLYMRCVSQDDIRRLAANPVSERFPFVVVPANGGLFTTKVDRNVQDGFDMLHLPQVPVKPLEAALGLDVVQMMVFATRDEIESSGLFTGVLRDSVPTSWCPYFADIIPAGSDKAVGIEEMCRIFGFDISETMAFGDGHNDIGMLKAAGTGVAMGNAADAVKEAADYITTDADKDGIGNALRHFGVI